MSSAGGVKFQLSPQFSNMKAPADLYRLLLDHLTLCYPNVPLRSYLSLGGPESVGLSTSIMTYKYAIISQRRYWASTATSSAANSLIAVQSSAGSKSFAVGELLTILVLQQKEIGRHIFGHVRWLSPASIDVTETYWPAEFVFLYRAHSLYLIYIYISKLSPSNGILEGECISRGRR